MSKKFGVMDWYFQIWNLSRHVELYFQHRRDEIDILHLMDSKLHLPENIENINRILGISTIRYKKKYEQTCEEFKGFNHVP